MLRDKQTTDGQLVDFQPTDSGPSERQSGMELGQASLLPDVCV